MFKKIAGAVVCVAPMAAFAVGPDLTDLTSAVDLTTVIAAIMLVGGLKFAPQIAKYAVSTLSRMFPK